MLNGCSLTDAPNVKVVTVNNFIKVYEPISTLTPGDKKNILEMRQKQSYKITWDKFIDYTVINEKELDHSLKE